MSDQEKKKQALVKAQASGFAVGGHENPAFRTTTNKYDEVVFADEGLEQILRKVRAAWIRGLDSDNEKIAVDTAHKLTSHMYRPAAEVRVEHTGTTGGDTYNIVQIDSLSPDEKALLARAQKALGQDVLDLEAQD